MKISRKRIFDILRTWAVILIGNALVAFWVTAFIKPHGIIMAGTTGIGLAISRFFPVDTATAVLILNVFMLLLGLRVLGKNSLFTTVVSSLLYPLFLAVMQCMPGITCLTTDPLLGAALGMVMRVGSSTGGMDVVNLVMHKCLHWPVSIAVWITDILALCIQVPFSNTEQILYGIIMLAVESLVLNQVMLLGQSQIQLMIISQQFEDIRGKLLTDLQAGVTMMLIETGCVRRAGKGILCVIPPRKLFTAKELIYSIDPEAFLTITQIREVQGQGFSFERYMNVVPIRQREDLSSPDKCIER